MLKHQPGNISQPPHLLQKGHAIREKKKTYQNIFHQILLKQKNKIPELFVKIIGFLYKAYQAHIWSYNLPIKNQLNPWIGKCTNPHGSASWVFPPPPASMGLSPLNLRQEMGHLHTFHDVLLAFQKKKTARHFTSGGPAETTKVTRVRFVCFFLGGKWMNYIYSSHSDWKTGGPHFVVHLLEVHRQKHMWIWLMNISPQKDKTCFNMVQHPVNQNKVCFKVFVWCAYVVIVVVVKPIVPQHRYSWGKNPIFRATHPGRCFLVGNLRSFWIILMPMAIGLCKWSVVVLYLINVYMYELL